MAMWILLLVFPYLFLPTVTGIYCVQCLGGGDPDCTPDITPTECRGYGEKNACYTSSPVSPDKGDQRISRGCYAAKPEDPLGCRISENFGCEDFKDEDFDRSEWERSCCICDGDGCNRPRNQDIQDDNANETQNAPANHTHTLYQYRFYSSLFVSNYV